MMNNLLRGVTGLLAWSLFLSCAGAGALVAQAERKPGTIFKSEVDGLIGVLRHAVRGAELAALGGDSVPATAKILVAMAHCHRHYHKTDGPVVRPSMGYLIRSRRADGSFGDAAATAWAVEALVGIDPEGYADEVAQARRWLQRQQASVATYDAVVEAVLRQVRADVWPEHLDGGALDKARGWIEAPDSLDRAAAADVLLQLVACQAANRVLDHHQGQGAAGGTFSPAQEKAFQWLFAQQKDGVFSVTMGSRSFPDPALTGFGLLALQTKPKGMRTADEQAAITKGLEWLLQQQQPDGIFGERTPNYSTCVAVGALSRWDAPQVKPALEKAQKAILGFQNIEAAGYQSSDRDYGSIGYGGDERGDLSNLHFSLEALKATGLDDKHEAFAKAIVFLQRTQNLKSVNDFAGKVPDPDDDGKIIDATSGDDGGASYYPGNSNAGYLVQPDGKSIPRSYGSMTYALLKAYILTGLPKDDHRVQAAIGWIQRNWDLATNPGADPTLGEKVKYQGLFYYYMVLAQALDTAGLDKVRVVQQTASGQTAEREIDWRKALRAQLEGMQQADGTWLNGENGRWMESMPLLCTCYALVALERCGG